MYVRVCGWVRVHECMCVCISVFVNMDAYTEDNDMANVLYAMI